MTLATIYENGWGYHILHYTDEIIHNQYKSNDIITLLKINNFKKTLNLILVNRNDNTLKTFDRAIFNLYATIGISNKNFSKYEFNFSLSNPLFNNLSLNYGYSNNNMNFIKDYTYYDKYNISNDNEPKIIMGERYNKQYWISSIDEIKQLIRKYTKKDLLDEYAVIEITEDNPYYYHYIMLNSPDTVFLIDSINKYRTIKNDILKIYSSIYPYKNFN